MELDVGELTKRMLSAASDVVEGKWPEVRRYAEYEFEELARLFARVELHRATGQITDLEAKALYKVHRNAAETVLSAIEGMTLILAEMAVNAALGVVREAVNGAIGFDLV